MAGAALTDQDAFRCSVCLYSLKDPVTISCGHNYCMSCISDCWDEEDQKGVYSCPQCRETFRPRPVLRKNTMLAELVEKMKKNAIQAAPTVSCTGPGDVECDICTERKLKAVRFCLGCLVSMCETHIQPHYDVPALKKHKLVQATSHLQDRICAKHDKFLEVFCRTDQTSICMLCTMDEHKGHETVIAATERAEKQNQLGEMQNRFQQGIQETEEDLKKLRETSSLYKNFLEEALVYSEKIFAELVQYIERKHSEVKEVILAQQKVSQVEGILQDLEQRITELKRGDAELAELSQDEDHVHFLQRFHTFTNSPALKYSPIMIGTPTKHFDDLRQSLYTLRQRVENICETDIMNISEKITNIVIGGREPTRQDFLKYSCPLKLNPGTASSVVGVFQNNTEARALRIGTEYLRSDCSKSFDVNQLLCTQGLSGCCYWEIEWSHETRGIDIGVAYKDIKRKGWDSRLGFNDQSWSLSCRPNKNCSFCHNNNKTLIPAVPAKRIGVYLNHKKGILSFYSVVDNRMTLLHTVHTTFTKPLYPGFWLDYEASVKICKETV